MKDYYKLSNDSIPNPHQEAILWAPDLIINQIPLLLRGALTNRGNDEHVLLKRPPNAGL